MKWSGEIKFLALFAAISKLSIHSRGCTIKIAQRSHLRCLFAIYWSFSSLNGLFLIWYTQWCRMYDWTLENEHAKPNETIIDVSLQNVPLLLFHFKMYRYVCFKCLFFAGTQKSHTFILEHSIVSFVHYIINWFTINCFIIEDTPCMC